jgi:hypothetical protein
MNIPTLMTAQQGAYSPFNQPMTRGDKASQFVESALPTALLTGLQALHAPAGSTPLPTATFPNAAGRLGTAANVAGGIIGIMDLAMNWGRSSPAAGASSGMAIGASIGTLFAPGIGTAIGIGAGALVGGLFGCITAGKHKDQRVRDSVRDLLVQGGIINSDFQLQLADGSLYDMGKDGGPRAELGGRRPYEIDYSHPLAQYAIAWMDPIIALLAQGNTKIQTDFVGYFTNAILSNAKDLNDVRANVGLFLSKFGLTNDQLANAITQMANAGMIDQNTARGWIGGIQQRMDRSFMGGVEVKSAQASEEIPSKE